MLFFCVWTCIVEICKGKSLRGGGSGVSINTYIWGYAIWAECGHM